MSGLAWDFENSTSPFEHVASENLAAAVLIRDRLMGAVELLSEHPFIGAAGQKPGTREFPVPGTPYTLVYRVTRAKLKIGRVLHQRRRYP